MNKLLGLLLFTTFGLTSCNNQQTKLDTKTEIGKINDFLKQYEEPSQTFKVSADKPTPVKGKQGTIISVNPDDLVKENGQSLGKNIEVELKELTNQEQLLRTNAQTTSNGQLLVSGGACFINMTSDGQQLRLKGGKTLSVEFPKFSNNEMSLFYGQRDTLGQMNWQQAEQKFVSNVSPTMPALSGSDTSVGAIQSILNYIESEPASADEKKLIALSNSVYRAVELSQFGWINCDRFDDVTDKTNLQYAFSDKDSIVSANVYLVFKEINSVVQSTYFSFDNKEYNSGFPNIPVGAKTQVIAFSIKGGRAYTYKSDLTIKANDTIQLTLEESSQKQVDNLFQLN